MSKATFEGSTLEAALEQAASELGVEVADLQHEVAETKQDFWGGGDTIVIKAWLPAAAPAPKETAADPVDAAPKPADPPAVVIPSDETPADTDSVDETPAAAEAEVATPAAAAEPEAATAKVEEATPPSESTEKDSSGGQSQPVADDSEGIDPEAIKGLLVQIFHDMEFDCTVEIKAQDDGFLATVDGADKESLLEGNGRCLSALELILNNAFRHKLPRGSKVHVDAGDFRSRRDQELADLALQVADSAKDSGRTQETQPLNPYERRLVHLALAEDNSVTTRSRGTGFLKNVQVIPQNADDDDRQQRG